MDELELISTLGFNMRTAQNMVAKTIDVRLKAIYQLKCDKQQTAFDLAINAVRVRLAKEAADKEEIHIQRTLNFML
jgi:nickel-dependent lactate racemase